MSSTLYNHIAARTSKITTRSYSTSFSIGIYFLSRKLHTPIYAIYGFVRLADEIVDTFHNKDQEQLLGELKTATYQAIDQQFSLNPILHSFQKTVHRYDIPSSLINQFLESMAMDLEKDTYNYPEYKKYILGSAEVVGLMCLKVFTDGNNELYESLKPQAKRLGAAFQKVNFLRDVQSDYHELGRTYFPHTNLSNFTDEQKQAIEAEIRKDFEAAYKGVIQLPKSARLGVYIAYIYYYNLFEKIVRKSPSKILQKRIRIPNGLKMGLMVKSLIRYNLNWF